MTKELTKSKLEIENLQSELINKKSEIKHLHSSIDEFNDMKEKYFITEKLLSSQLRTNQVFQDKLRQLETDLLTKEKTPDLNESCMNDTVHESLIENLRLIIQEQLTLRNSSVQQTVEELKFKVNSLGFIFKNF